MSTRLLLLVCLAVASAAPTTTSAQTEGALAPEFIEELRQMRLQGSGKALADIVAGTNVRDIALNRERYLSHNSLVNHRIKSGSITAQKGSGRCWMFAGFNVLRPEMIKKHDLKDFEFSENYLFFWDKLEKVNVFFEEMINRADDPIDDRRLEIVLDNPLGDGGWWSYFVDLVNKYGVVPNEVMPESHNSSSTGMMNKLVGLKTHEMGLSLRNLARDGMGRGDLEKRKKDYLKEIYRLLVMHLGEPPTEFTWRYESKSDSTGITVYPKTLTPKTFLREVVDPDLDAYVALFNYPGKAYDQTYSFELSRNIHDRSDFTLLNVPIETLKACALASVLDSSAVWFACDVGQENHRADGILALDIYNYELIYDTTFDMAKKDLIQLGLITPNHAMTFVGVDTMGTTVNKWLVENSWGEKAGDSGMWYMYPDWFDRYLFGAIIHERYLSEDLRERARMTPVTLPPWDPMWALSKLETRFEARESAVPR